MGMFFRQKNGIYLIIEIIFFIYICIILYKSLLVPFKKEWLKEEFSLSFMTKLIKFSTSLNIVLSLFVLFLISFSFSLSEHIDIVSSLTKEVLCMVLDKK